MKTKISLNKKDIISFLLIILCLFMIKLFPEKDHFQKLIISLTFLLIVPVLYVKIVLKENLRKFGLKVGEWKPGLIWIFISLVVSSLILYLIYNYLDFAEKYYLPQKTIESFGLFIFYETAIAGFFIALYEFFFRGFIMFGFSEKLKHKAIILQFILFILFLIINKDFNWIFAPYMMTALFSGVIAYKSKSLIYSFLFSWLFIILSDAVYINSLIH